MSPPWATRVRCSTIKPKLAYRRRLSELREELEEAKELGNSSAQSARTGVRGADQELSRASDFGGLIGGRFGLERARQSITKTSRRC